ncbi:MAG: hypothetical protein MHMPM18_003448 [Marteilia pararefringens]
MVEADHGLNNVSSSNIGEKFKQYRDLNEPFIRFLNTLIENREKTNGWLVCVEMMEENSTFVLKFVDGNKSRNFSKIMPLFTHSINEKLSEEMIHYIPQFSRLCESITRIDNVVPGLHSFIIGNEVRIHSMNLIRKIP